MFTAGSDMNISRFSAGCSKIVTLLSNPPRPETVVPVENRPQNHARVHVTLHQDVGLAVAAHGHALDGRQTRIGLVDHLDAAERQLGGSGGLHDALLVADQHRFNQTLANGLANAFQAFFTVRPRQHQRLADGTLLGKPQEFF